MSRVIFLLAFSVIAFHASCQPAVTGRGWSPPCPVDSLHAIEIQSIEKVGLLPSLAVSMALVASGVLVESLPSHVALSKERIQQHVQY